MADVWLEERAREAIAAEAAKRRFRETGGPLFGYEASGGLVVVRALGPGPNAKHRRTRLIPDSGDVQEAIDAVFQESEGKLLYLGDWHTHPWGDARPSGVDVRGATAIADDPAVGVERPLVVIQATRPFQVHVGMGSLGVFRWDPQRRELIAQDVIISRPAPAS